MKLYFNLSSDLTATTVESLWAELTSQNTAIIKNTPFYVDNVSFLDEVTFKTDDLGQNFFTGMVRKSGHSTYRILQLSQKQKDQFDKYWEPLERLGCAYESNGGANVTLYVVDIPPNTNIQQVYELLQSGERDGAWHFEEADFAHPGKK